MEICYTIPMPLMWAFVGLLGVALIIGVIGLVVK